MDLISRKSVAEKMLYRRDYVGRPSDPDCIIADEPSVPAVPLEPLCEWLAKTKTPPCEIGLIGFKCVDVSLNCSDYEKCWKMAFAKWMEEQDATD